MVGGPLIEGLKPAGVEAVASARLSRRCGEETVTNRARQLREQLRLLVERAAVDVAAAAAAAGLALGMRAAPFSH